MHRSGTPEELIAACADQGIPLFEVPYRTPFIAVARAHSEAIAAQAYARRTWALDTQRASPSPPSGRAGSRRSSPNSAVDSAPGRACSTRRGRPDRRPPPRRPLGDCPGRARDPGPGDPRPRTRGGSVPHPRCAHLHALHGGAGRAPARRPPPWRPTPSTRRPGPSSPRSSRWRGLAREQSEQLARGRRRLHTQLLRSLLSDDPGLARRVLGSLPPAPWWWR
ncbi:hypothetical protein AB1285_19240 [Microbacterium sp. NRRL B-14842]|uniref:hypothetical protein n=1 Tax=Microbacterium sp. NRRL B-14842 TaxID=3162881 RepID=UPI003D2DADC6